jgi:hypothetical protein
MRCVPDGDVTGSFNVDRMAEVLSNIDFKTTEPRPMV